jgi:hypothetical protein
MPIGRTLSIKLHIYLSSLKYVCVDVKVFLSKTHPPCLFTGSCILYILHTRSVYWNYSTAETFVLIHNLRIPQRSNCTSLINP